MDLSGTSAWRRRLAKAAIWGLLTAIVVSIDRSLGSPIVGFFVGTIGWVLWSLIWDWGKRREAGRD